jgi:hypothetical protein
MVATPQSYTGCSLYKQSPVIYFLDAIEKTGLPPIIHIWVCKQMENAELHTRYQHQPQSPDTHKRGGYKKDLYNSSGLKRHF